MRLLTLREDELRALTLSPDSSVQQAMTVMNRTGRTLLLVADPGDRLVGVVADGDIRRFLAGDGDVAGPITSAMNTAPTTAPSTMSPGEARAVMGRRGLEYLPLVDESYVVDALCILDRAPRASERTVVVMAGGLGSRLSPLTDDCPKPLLPLAGKPILSHIIDGLRDQGVHRLVFSVNHLAHMIVDHYDDGSDWDCFIDYVHEPKRLGTGGSLGLIDPDVLSDPFICLNGDVIHDIDIGALHTMHVENGWDATMVVRPHTFTIPYGVVQTGPRGEFQRVDEKPVQSFVINAGVYMLSKSVLDVVPHDTFYDLTDMFRDLGRHGLVGGTYVHPGRWIDIGTMHEYERAQQIFSERGLA